MRGYGGSEVEFIIDDKRITAEQFIDMLTIHERWQAELQDRIDLMVGYVLVFSFSWLLGKLY